MNDRKVWGRQRTRWVAAFAGMTVLAALQVALPVVADAQSDAPPVPSVPTVKVHAVPYTSAHLKDETSASSWHPKATAWPSAGVAVVDLTAQSPSTGATAASTPRRARAGSLPVWVAPVAPRADSKAAAPKASGSTTAGSSPSKIRIEVTARDAASKAGVNGVLFTASATENTSATGKASVSVDYSSFKDAFGGDWSERLHLVQLPACALTTPEKPACRTQTPLATRRDAATHQLTADVALPQAAAIPVTSPAAKGTTGGTASTAPSAQAAAPMVLAATAAASGGTGSFGATPLAAAGSWTAGGNSGDFTYSYPIGVPPVPGGLAPGVSLQYDSQSLDGLTASTNNQASWVGDGWSYAPGSISRSYSTCSDDPAGTAPKVSDLCWAGQIVHISLAGHSGDLVYDASVPTHWRLSNDNGEKVEQLTGGTNGTHDGDYWKITSTDGTQYFFGLNHLPGYAAGKTETKSAWTVPVYGAHTGDPCNSAAGFAASQCMQAWQWNLDYTVDIHGNAMSYYYDTDVNYYGANNGTTGVKYDRDGHLRYIDYGFTDGNAYTDAPRRVAFTTEDRCVATTCNPIATNQANWPDVPYDQNCADKATCANHSPTFWSTRRLTAISTQLWNSGQAKYLPVDTYTLKQHFPDPGDNGKPSMFLDSIQRTGNNGGTLDMPKVTFTGQPLANRFDIGNGYVNLVRWRVSGITSEAGNQTSIVYSSASCARPADLSANTSLCYPVYWTPVGQSVPILDWFNKYVVRAINDHDSTGASSDRLTSYEYLGNLGWHFDDNEVTKAKYRTYGQWRGYSRVRTRTGTVDEGQTLSESRYYLGMDGDTLPAGKKRTATVALATDVTVPGAAASVPDDNELAGSVRETITYKGDGGPVVSASVDDYWVGDATATRTRTGLPDLTARISRNSGTRTTTAITSTAPTTWRTTRVEAGYDKATGLVVAVDDHGDISDPAQETCSTTTYAPPNTNKNLVGLPAELETDAAACGQGGTTSNGMTAPASVNRPVQVISDVRTFYDTPTPTSWPPATPEWPQQAPTKGDITLMQQAADYANGAFTYQLKAATTFDPYGRAIATYDALGRKSATTYTPATSIPTQITTSNAKNQTTVTTLDPARSTPMTVVDANGAKSEITYDAFGRTTAVWQPSRNKAAGQSASATFAYKVSATAPSAVTTQTLLESGAYSTSVKLYDGLLRERQTQSQTPVGGRLLTDVTYDSHGWATRVNHPYLDGSSASTTTLVATTGSQVVNQDVITYDRLGRPTLDVSLDQGATVSQTRTIYGGDRTTVIPPTGGTPTTTITDARGRTIETDNYQSMPAVSGDQVTGGSPLATRFTFDAAGSHSQNTVITDPAGSQRQHTYNLLGQETSQSDPDTGTTSMAYDAADQLTSTTDARNKTISVTYDELGRKTATFDGPDSTSPKLTSLTYDDPAVANGIGRTTASARYTTSGAYTTAISGFTIDGKPLGSTTTIPDTVTGLAGTYRYTYTYTPTLGLPYGTAFPAAGTLPAETVTSTYTLLGQPLAVGGLSGYTSTTSYDALGNVAQTTLGSRTNRAFRTNYHDEHTNALTEVTTDRTVAPARIEDTTYTRDKAGNTTRIADNRLGTAGDTQCFSYNLLGRMTDAWSATDACTAAPSTTAGSATVGGPDPYWSTWTFDANGNRKTQNQHGLTPGTGDTTTAYTYGKGGDPTQQPDTLTGTQTTGADGTKTGSRYVYDALGNTTTRTTTPGTDTLIWNHEGKLESLKSTGQDNPTTYTYDAGGNQLLRTDPDGKSTLYLPGQEVVYNPATKATTGTRYIALPGGVTCTRTGAGTAYNFVASNDQATGTTSLDATAQTPTFRLVDPYGNPRGTQPASWPGTQGFVGGTKDTTTGLTHLGARDYDPTLGRFISADPLFEATDPNQIGGYTYAGNNPVTYSDPSGLMVYESDEKGGVSTGGGTDIPVWNRECAGKGGNSAGNMCSDRGPRTGYHSSGGGYKWAAEFERAFAHRIVSVVAPIKMAGNGIKDGWSCVSSGDRCGELLNDYKEALIATDPLQTFVVGPVENELDIIKDVATGHSADAAGKIAADVALAVVFKKVGEKAGLCPNSFTGDTQVDMADGSKQAIDQVKIGDRVTATDPITGTTKTETVTDVIVTQDDKDFTDLTVQTPDGDHTITSTQHHPYWNATHNQWENAADLHPGDKLRQPDGTLLAIVSVRNYHRAVVTYNLTVDRLHTYYVVAGETPILVHNGGPCGPIKGAAGEARAIQELQDRGYTIMGEHVKLEGKRGAVSYIDIVATRNGSGLGAPEYFEVKNGPGAKLSRPQKIVYGQLGDGGNVILRTDKLEMWGLKNGDLLPQADVNVILYGGAKAW
ncbi:hypothetical protein G3I60_36945 [Streptomyces sp. SID13666]|uniref:RHS repeat-associated core domain-containing protein n=1 Tax=unclassified Streptomyces TaxID=2593676 RepID=UPI0013C180E8|nr:MULTISPECIES: RHS repeat-associated core domain-containing protein [unclassified Streptomyces]NEA59600.1 hypothetical protein [Streptomyces sp. SID13666]NEA75782.1 hypothetical protein [Streptomyces sp. SID13588]